MKLKFEYIIIGVLLVIILFMGVCNKPCPTNPTITTTTITKWDTLKIETPRYIPKYIKKVGEPIIVYLPPITDTAFALEELMTKYYSFYNVKDTIDHDSVKIYIDDTLSENKITSRQVKYNINYPTKIITRTITYPAPKSKRELYYGFGLGGSQQGFNYLGGELMLKTKNKKSLGLGVGINNNIKPVVNLRMLWKVGK